jgi:hypothetical protein
MTEQENKLLELLSSYTDMYILADFKLKQLNKKTVTAGTLAQQLEIEQVKTDNANKILQTMIEYRSPLVEYFMSKLKLKP